jgi:2-methylfumaryl-CoA hydratase
MDLDAYTPGERIDHIDGMTVEEAEHQIATRLYQNTARGHFDRRLQAGGRFGHRIVYGGHVMSLARALSFNGLQNAFWIAAINGGRHVNPVAAGDTVYCWSQVVDCQPLPGRDDIGAIRLRTVATRDLPCEGFPEPGGPDGAQVVLDLDYWALMPRRSAARCTMLKPIRWTIPWPRCPPPGRPGRWPRACFGRACRCRSGWIT